MARVTRLVLGAEPEVLDRRDHEQFRQCQRVVRPALDPGRQTDHEQRVPAQVEEVIGDADRVSLEQVFPDR